MSRHRDIHFKINQYIGARCIGKMRRILGESSVYIEQLEGTLRELGLISPWDSAERRLFIQNHCEIMREYRELSDDLDGYEDMEDG